MSIRPFKSSDLKAVHKLIRLTVDTCYTPVYHPGVVEFFKSYHSQDKIRKRSRKGKMFVADQDGEIVGTGALVDNEIQGVFIHPDFQQRGIGKGIMAVLEREAKSRNFDEVTLDISIPARQFYRDLGYAVVQECSFRVATNVHLRYWTAVKSL